MKKTLTLLFLTAIAATSFGQQLGANQLKKDNTTIRGNASNMLQADTTVIATKYYVGTVSSSITLGPIGSSPNANGSTITGSTLNLEPASASFGGVVTTGAQTFAGVKTLTAPVFATSVTGSYLTASEMLGTDGSKNIVSLPVATYPSLTELSYVKGLTSAIQTQLGQQKLIDVANALCFVVSNPSDGATVYFGMVSTLSVQPTAPTRQFQLPTGTLRRASMMIDATGVAGSNEAITVNLRNITDGTSTFLGTVTSDARGSRTSSGPLSITTDASKFYSIEVVYPFFTTNPTNVEWAVTLMIFEQ